MFIIDLHYKVPLSQIEKHIPGHRKFLDTYYSENIFVSSGPKNPRTGGIILADCKSKTDILEIIKEDPFYKNNLADYSITEFNPNKGSFIK